MTAINDISKRMTKGRYGQMRIEQICYDCAIKKGWKPVPYPVGMWRGICDVCKQEKSLSAPRDYIKKEND